MLGAEKMEKLVNEMEPIATQMSWQINIKTVKQEMDHFSNKREGGMEERKGEGVLTSTVLFASASANKVPRSVFSLVTRSLTTGRCLIARRCCLRRMHNISEDWLEPGKLHNSCISSQETCLSSNN